MRSALTAMMILCAVLCGCRSIPDDDVAYPAGDGELINNQTGEVIDVGPK
jgi:hypothetical protein